MSPRARLMWTTETLVQAVLLVAVPFVLAGPMDLFDVPWWAWLLWVLVLAAYVATVPSWRYAVHRWEVTDTAVYTQTGWWTRERRIAPMSRIQTVDHVEGAIARLFGLATVTVTTASARGPVEIAGLAADDATALARMLTETTQATPGDAT